MSSLSPSQPNDQSAALAAARTFGDALAQATRWLRALPGNDTAVLDAQLLLAHVTGLSRVTTLAYPSANSHPTRRCAMRRWSRGGRRMSRLPT